MIRFDTLERKPFENIVGKGEIAHNELFLFFPQCVQKAFFPGVSKGVIVWEWVKGTVKGREWTDCNISTSLVKLNLGLYSPTILKNILCLFLQDLQIGM